MKIFKLSIMFLTILSLVVTFACAKQNPKIIADQPGYGVVSVVEPAPAPLPKVANIKEVVYFNFDKKEVVADSLPILDKVAALVKANPDTALVLNGHTDKFGSDEYNLELSKARTETVKAELVSRGVEQNMIKVVWFGKADLVSKIHKENRRVLILSID